MLEAQNNPTGIDVETCIDENVTFKQVLELYRNNQNRTQLLEVLEANDTFNSVINGAMLNSTFSNLRNIIEKFNNTKQVKESYNLLQDLT